KSEAVAAQFKRHAHFVVIKLEGGAQQVAFSGNGVNAAVFGKANGVNEAQYGKGTANFIGNVFQAGAAGQRAVSLVYQFVNGFFSAVSFQGGQNFGAHLRQFYVAGGLNFGGLNQVVSKRGFYRCAHFAFGQAKSSFVVSGGHFARANGANVATFVGGAFVE